MSKITIIKNGPAIIEGIKELPNVILTEPDGLTQTRTKFALCRCGKSVDGILCDGSHVNTQFDERKLQSRASEGVQ